jgi:hypothetical protein
MKMLFVGTPAALLLVAGCWKSQPTDLEKREARRADIKHSVAFDASLAAKNFVKAARECRIAGIDHLKSCAENKGLLEPEITAQLYAEIALADMRSYQAKCSEHFSTKYCDQLLQKASQMEWRRPTCGDLFEKTEEDSTPSDTHYEQER